MLSTNKQTPSKFTILFVYANSMMDNLIPVSISSLAASLKKDVPDLNVILFDTTFYRTSTYSGDDLRVQNLQIPPFRYADNGVSLKESDVYEDIEKVVTINKPDLIALSTVEPTFNLGLSLLKRVKKFGIPTIVGGIHAIFSPEDVISEHAVDMVCVGEGEKCLAILCRNMLLGKQDTDIPGIWFKKNGTIIRNQLDNLINLDDLPALDFSIYEKETFYRPMHGKIYKMVPVEFSRGCPYRCTYCADHGLENIYRGKGRWYRKKSIKKIITEIEEYVEKYNAQYFYFVSETFLAMDDERFNDFVKKYANINIPFWFNTRPETVTAARISKLKEINCHRISVGVEHGNEEFRRDLLNRRVTNERIIEACKIIERSKIQCSVNNIIGFPGETRDLVFDTINLNRQISPDSSGCYFFTPYRGTKLRALCVEKGYIPKDHVAIDLNIEPSLNMPQLSRKELMGLMRTFNLYVKFPENMWDRVREAESFSDKGNTTFEELKELYWQRYSKQ